MRIMMVPMPDIPSHILLKAGKAAFRVPEVSFQLIAIQPIEEVYQFVVHGPEVTQG